MKVHFLIHLQIAMLCGFDEDALDLLRSCVERLCEEYNADAFGHQAGIPQSAVAIDYVIKQNSLER